MKNSIFTILAAVTILCGCTDDDNSVTPTPVAEVYFPLSSGSTWTYETTGGGKTILSQDSATGTVTINGRKYTNIFTKIEDPLNPYSYTESYRRSGDTLFLLNNNTESIVLVSKKDAVWASGFTNSSFSQTDTSRVLESGIQRSVNGRSYSNVYHVHTITTTTMQGQNTLAESDMYYAKDIGLIEQISPNVTIRLKSYSIK